LTFDFYSPSQPEQVTLKPQASASVTQVPPKQCTSNIINDQNNLPQKTFNSMDSNSLQDFNQYNEETYHRYERTPLNQNSGRSEVEVIELDDDEFESTNQVVSGNVTSSELTFSM